MKYYFSISMTRDEFLPYYQGKIHAIVTNTNEGVRVQFPAMHLRKYLTANGISGYFCLETQQNKFLALHKLS
ncbi:MAG: DUF2835 domain-containing protein [Colwellia sp.]